MTATALSPRATKTIPAMIERIIPAIATRGRVLSMLIFGFVPVVLGILINRASANGQVDDVVPAELIDAFTLTIYVPLVVLIFASATLGTLREERTLVYFWLRPIGRWQIAVAALLSSWLVLIPLVAVPTTAFAWVIGDSTDIAGALLSALAGIIAYGAVFTALGLVTKRALVWGLLYILIWEGFIGGLSQTAGRLSIRNYTRSLLGDITNFQLLSDPESTVTVLIVVVAVAVLSTGLATMILNRMDVD